MNNIGINVSAFANVVTPFSPVGKQAVGLEDADARENILPPVEEPDSGARLANENEETETEESNTSQGHQQNREDSTEEREEQQLIDELAARDREVRAHERAHASVGGQYAGAPSYTYQRGPDGVNYAVSGEVPISLPSGEGDPEHRAEAAEQVRRAALAPADPSLQDRRIAAAAASLAREARTEVAEEQREQQRTEREEEAEKQRQAATKEEALAATDDQRQNREQRLEELSAAARRSSQLTEQLVTVNNIERNNNIGAVFDQLA